MRWYRKQSSALPIAWASAERENSFFFWNNHYRKISNIRRTLVDNKIVDHSDVVGASPVGAAPTTSSFST